MPLVTSKHIKQENPSELKKNNLLSFTLANFTIHFFLLSLLSNTCFLTFQTYYKSCFPSTLTLTKDSLKKRKKKKKKNLFILYFSFPQSTILDFPLLILRYWARVRVRAAQTFCPAFFVSLYRIGTSETWLKESRHGFPLSIALRVHLEFTVNRKNDKFNQCGPSIAPDVFRQSHCAWQVTTILANAFFFLNQSSRWVCFQTFWSATIEKVRSTFWQKQKYSGQINVKIQEDFLWTFFVGFSSYSATCMYRSIYLKLNYLFLSLEYVTKS